MTNWRDHILAHFAPETARLTLVADPDELLLEEGILNAIRARGFDLIRFDDPVAFRFSYESQYRQRWDRGENTELVVVLRAEEDDLRNLPFDLLQAGRRLPAFRIATIFPKLSNPIVQALERSLLDRLYTAYVEYDGTELGDRSTKSFILRSVFRCTPELVRTPGDLLRLLCEKHSTQERFPPALDQHILEILRSAPGFEDWPLEHIVGERDAFLRFLQERWPAFVADLAIPGSDSQPAPAIPFPEVRAFVDTLFLDGLLKPIPLDDAVRLPDWVRVGVVVDRAGSILRRLAALLDRLETETPSVEATYKEWQRFAWRLSELKVLANRGGSAVGASLAMRTQSLRDAVTRTFGDWMLSRFGSLANLVERDGHPVMLHQVARYLANRRRVAGETRIALLVVDGLALDQWLLVREAIESKSPNVRIEESAVFAWVPTLTCISRQTIFAGEIPLLLADSLLTTSKEESHWRRVWEDADVPALSVGYRRNVGTERGDIADLAEHPRMQVLGLVINTVDEVMHGTVLGAAGMHQSVQLWAEQGHLGRTIEQLQRSGFAVYLTADHGNFEAVGQGRPAEGSLVEARGSRARVYESDLFREQVRQKFSDTIVWPGAGLPINAKVLLAAQGTAFAPHGERVIAHGGISVEEVLVPFVRFWRE